MQQYRDVFLSEAAEYLQAITDALLALEADPNDLEPVETLFRGAHSLKGMAAMMNYDRTAELTHKMESLMDSVRKREQAVDSSLIDLMLRATDVVRAVIDDESNGKSEVDTTEMVGFLGRRAEGDIAAEEAPSDEIAPEPEEQTPAEESQPEAPVDLGEGEGTLYRVTISLDQDSVLKSVRAYMALKRLNHMGSVVDTKPSARELEDEQFGDSFEAIVRTNEGAEEIVRALTAISEVAEVQVAVIAERAEGRPAAESAPSEQGDAVERTRRAPRLSDTQTVRVSIAHLDTLVNLVGELVILRSRLAAISSTIDRRDLNEALEDLHRVSGELQHEVMQTRMVPVGNIFNRFPRMVRDLAHDLGKEVAFDMGGLDIELDRTVLDEIGDPIVHLLRNSIDHGIEPPERRRAAGKPERGRVSLTAVRERDQVRIVVSDDGKGIDPEKIWAKACKLGLAETTARDSYSIRDILAFTCVPGFSTAEQTTKVSGRGVGMDVVKGKIEHLGGTLVIHSVPGQGTEFVLTLPLTLAIIQALMLGARGQVFALPLSAVSEVLSLDEIPIRSIDGSPVVVLRDESVAPLMHLECLLAGEGSVRAVPEEGHIVLLESGSDVQALAVPTILGRQEIVIKPLSPMFKQIRGLGGATVLGDGRVALILDPRSLLTGGRMEDCA